MKTIDLRSTNWRGEVCYIFKGYDCIQIRHELSHNIKQIKTAITGHGFDLKGYQLAYIVPSLYLSLLTDENKRIQNITRKVLTQSQLDFT